MGDLKLTGALASPRNAAIGRDVGELVGAPACGVRASADRDQALEGAQVAIDFTLAPAVEDNVRACERRRCALVIGATGLSQAALKQIQTSAARVPILVSPNTSLGISLLERLAAQAARALGEDFDVEIIDTHHRDKADAPSGTALRLGETIAGARGIEFAKAQILSRQGHTGRRERGKIGFAVVRAGDHVGRAHDHVLRAWRDNQPDASRHRSARSSRGAPCGPPAGSSSSVQVSIPCTI